MFDNTGENLMFVGNDRAGNPILAYHNTNSNTWDISMTPEPEEEFNWWEYILWIIILILTWMGLL